METPQNCRKVATYGKASRRPVFGYSAGDSSNHTSTPKRPLTYADGVRDKRFERGLPTSLKGIPEPDTTSSSDEITRSAPKAHITPLPKKQNMARSPATIAVANGSERLRSIKRRPSAKDEDVFDVPSSGDETALPRTPVAEGKQKPRKSAIAASNGHKSPRAARVQQPLKNDTIFDVPSSDDELSARKPSPKRPLKRPANDGLTKGPALGTKPLRTGMQRSPSINHIGIQAKQASPATRISPSRKRKAEALVSGATTPAVLDDSLLQRHIAMQYAIESDSAAPSSDIPLDDPFREFQTVKRERKKSKEKTSQNVLILPPPQENSKSSSPLKRKPVLQQPMSQKSEGRSPGRVSGVRTSPRSAMRMAGYAKIGSPRAAVTPRSPKDVIVSRKQSRAASPQSPFQNDLGKRGTGRLRTPPRSGVDRTPRTVTKSPKRASNGTDSPRQTELWSQLLEPDADGKAEEGPHLDSRRAIRPNARANARDVPEGPRVHMQSADSMQNTQQPRKRLIDLLAKQVDEAAQQHFESKESDSDSDNSTISDRQPPRLPSPAPVASQPDLATVIESQISAASTASQSNSQVRAVLEQGGPRLTYARERSYLTESVLDETTLFSQPLDVGTIDLGSQSRRMGRPSRPAMPKSDFDMDDDDEENSTSQLKSIHELRQAGGNKRFRDETEALIEDIESRGKASVSRRRNALLELSSKMVEKAFARRFVDQSLDSQVLVDLDQEKDVLSGSALVSIIALLGIHGSSPILQHALDQGAGPLCTTLLSETRTIPSIAKDRRSNMSKVAQTSALQFSTLLLASSIFISTPPPLALTPQLLALRCLELLTRQAHDSIGKSNIFTPAAANELITLIASADEVIAHLALFNLEAITLHPTPPISSTFDFSRITTHFLRLAASTDPPRDAQSLTLRVLLNITNNNPAACGACGTQPVIHALTSLVASGFATLSGYLPDDDARLAAVDYLILALATLINFAEWSDAARVHTLSGGDSQSAVPTETLLKLFVQGLGGAAEADSISKTHSNVAFGYLAVLLGTLCLNWQVRGVVAGQLPGGTLRPLSEAVGEFLSYHRKVDAQLDSAGEPGEHGSFTQRLEGMVKRLDGKGGRDDGRGV